MGEAGVGKTVLTKFVSWLNDLTIFTIKANSRYTIADFEADLRSIMRRVGVDGEKISFIFDESNALDSSFLELMNALLASDSPARQPRVSNLRGAWTGPRGY